MRYKKTIAAFFIAVTLLPGFSFDKMSDKAKHLFMGAGISWLAGAAAELADSKPDTAALATGISAGLAKELWDMLGSGEPDIGDFFMTCAGSLLAYSSIRMANTDYKNYTLPAALSVFCALSF